LSADREIQALAQQLDEAYRHNAAILPCHPDVQIEQLNGKVRLSLTPLDKLDEPLSLVKLREQAESLLPRVDLPDAILAIHAFTGFADEFAHIMSAWVSSSRIPAFVQPFTSSSVPKLHGILSAMGCLSSPGFRTIASA
jgi:hypothetical protein